MWLLAYCFRALRDADKAITFAPQSPKGYYRRGEALRGLKVNLHLTYFQL
jgi:hypothetical protein